MTKVTQGFEFEGYNNPSEGYEEMRSDLESLAGLEDVEVEIVRPLNRAWTRGKYTVSGYDQESHERLFEVLMEEGVSEKGGEVFIYNGASSDIVDEIKEIVEGHSDSVRKMALVSSEEDFRESVENVLDRLDDLEPELEEITSLNSQIEETLFETEEITEEKMREIRRKLRRIQDSLDEISDFEPILE
ncbi:hypothetical protein ACEU6E_03745 [Halorutilales archaeon Cl-col2-1]